MARQEADTVAREIASRILELRKDGETDADFARRLGITPQLLNHYKKGGGASVEVVARITRNEPRAYWLLTGEETPSDEWTRYSLDMVRFAGGSRDLTDDERKLVRRDILVGIIRLGTAEGKDVGRFQDLLREMEEEGLPAPRPAGSMGAEVRLRPADLLRLYERETAIALERTIGMKHLARAAELDAEEARERRLGLSAADQAHQDAIQGFAALDEAEAAVPPDAGPRPGGPPAPRAPGPG